MNTEEESQIKTMEEENFKLPNHPLLSLADDEFFYHIVEELAFLAESNYSQNFRERMRAIIFDEMEISELQGKTFCESTVCSKSLSSNEIYFVCLDCDLSTHPNLFALLCSECFEKSDHKGHRLFIKKAREKSSANCDCGDARLLKPEGFCSNHQSKPINIQELYESFPQDLRVKFEGLTKKSIYSVVSLFELKQHVLPGKVFDLLSALADNLMGEMLSFWIECYSDINRAFLPILWTTLRSKFESPYDLVWHDCEDLQAENKYSQEPHKCTCSLLGGLLRMSNLVNKENQGKLKKILAECVKDQDFMEHLSLEFTKYIHYFFTQNYDSEISGRNAADENSLIYRLYLHLYKDDKIIEKVLDSGYFENFLILLKKVVDSCPSMNQISSLILFQMKKVLEHFLIPTNISAKKLAKDEKFMQQYLDVIMTFQMKFYYTDKLTIDLFDHQIDYDSIKITLDSEIWLYKSFQNCMKVIFGLPYDEQKEVTPWLLMHWYLNLQNAKAALKAEEDGMSCQSFNPCLERLFCCVIINYMKKDISANNLESFIQEHFICVPEVALNTFEGPLRALGMVRYLHLTFNYNSAEVFHIYYSNYRAFFEIDMVTIQMMMLLMKSEEGLLFELLIENFFSYSSEIRGFFINPNEDSYEKKMLKVIEDFLYFLVFLMTDEICLFNVQSKYKKENFGQMDLNSRQKLALKNLLINILRGHYWTTGTEIIEVCDKFLPPHQKIDQILLEITIKDEKNQKIRIKDEFEAGFDPYIFYKSPSVRQDLSENFAAKNSQKNNSTIDLVSGGGQFDKEVPQYLQDIQVKLFQSNLPEFLCKYLKMANMKNGNTLIRLVLKLTLLNLQVAAEQESPILKQKVEEIYQNDDFLIALENISLENDLRDCRDCVEKIKKLLQKIPRTKDMLIENSPRILTKGDEKKKLSAQERMEQLKQSFAQKQAAFAQKNELIFQKSGSIEETEESKKDETLFCQHCMEKLHVSGKEYGLLIYVTFTNNFYETTAEVNFEEQSYKNLLKADWWPVISSCNHYYHKKCFEVFYKAPKEFEKDLLSNAYESFCPLCKCLYNNFLSINEEEKESDEINQEEPLEQLEEYPQISQSFLKKIQKTLVDLKARIAFAPEYSPELGDASFVSVETIFERAYQYFIESFYLLENPRNLEKSFKLYVSFFKAFRSYFTNKVPEDNLQLSAFFNVNSLFVSTQAFDSSREMNYKTEVYLVELLAKNLQRTLMISDLPHRKSELWALKDFILFKVTQIIAFYHFGDLNVKLEDCLLRYQSNENLRSVIREQLTFSIQKIILSYTLNLTATSLSPDLNLSELFDLLCKEANYQEEEYLTSLFKVVNIPYSFHDFITQIFQELESRPQSEIHFLKSLFDKSLFSSKEVLKPQLVKFSPRMIQLPQNFLEFNIQYFPKKCSLCNEYSSRLSTSICLVCGETMCTGYCFDDEDFSGNLNRHVQEYHMGMGAFLDIQRLYQSLVNTPLNLAYNGKSLYLNQIGQDIASFLNQQSPKQLGRLDFTEFKINQEYLKELIGMINQQALRREVFSVGLKIGGTTHEDYTL